MNKKEINIFSFIWIFIATIVFALRYLKIISVDYGIFGSTYISFTQKITNCSLPVVNILQTCQNVELINIFWWVIIGLLVIIQLVVLLNKFKK